MSAAVVSANVTEDASTRVGEPWPAPFMLMIGCIAVMVLGLLAWAVLLCLGNHVLCERVWNAALVVRDLCFFGDLLFLPPTAAAGSGARRGPA
jgi:hypothetical protein